MCLVKAVSRIPYLRRISGTYQDQLYATRNAYPDASLIKRKSQALARTAPRRGANLFKNLSDQNSSFYLTEISNREDNARKIASPKSLLPKVDAYPEVRRPALLIADECSQ